MTEQWKPEVLVIGPAGAKGFLQLGAILALEEKLMLDKVKTYIGVSVGALISVLMICGYTINNIISEAIEINLFDDLSSVELKNLKSKVKEIQEKYGLLSNNNIKNKIIKLIISKLGFVPSLKQLYDLTSTKLIIVTLNLDSKQGTEYISVDNNPSISVVDAVMLSINIPLLFYTIKYNNDIYVDGGLGNPYPVDFCDDGKTKILGISVESFPPKKDNHCDENILLYMNRIIQSTTRQLKNRIIANSSCKCKHLILEARTHDTTGLSLSIDSKASMIFESYNYVKDWLIKNI